MKKKESKASKLFDALEKGIYSLTNLITNPRPPVCHIITDEKMKEMEKKIFPSDKDKEDAQKIRDALKNPDLVSLEKIKEGFKLQGETNGKEENNQ